MAGRRHVVSNRHGRGRPHGDGSFGFGYGPRRCASSDLITSPSSSAAAAPTFAGFQFPSFSLSVSSGIDGTKSKDSLPVDSRHLTAEEPTKDVSTKTSGANNCYSLYPASPSSPSQSPSPSPSPSTALLPGASSISLIGNMASPPTASKIHASPSKGSTSSMSVSAGRTYDAKLVQREMLRLGTLANQLPNAALVTLSNAASSTLSSGPSAVLSSSASAISVPVSTISHALGHAHSSGGTSGAGVSDASAWAQLHVHVLPLFNHEQLQSPIEDLNNLVKRHIEMVITRGPQRALATLEVDISELINSGMITLNTKLMGIDDEKLVARVVEIWGFFWDQVLPYVEGVFLPLQTDSLLLSLYSKPKSHRPNSPTMQDSLSSGISPIDVRALALRAFRDKIIVPIAPRFESRLIAMFGRDGTVPISTTSGSGSLPEATYQRPRLQQMLLVLHSQAQRARPSSAIVSPSYCLTPQEMAIRKLLDALSQHRSAFTSSAYNGTDANNNDYGSNLVPPTYPGHLNGLSMQRAPSFLSGGPPRDRRGRVADKSTSKRRGQHMVAGANRKGRDHINGELDEDDEDVVDGYGATADDSGERGRHLGLNGLGMHYYGTGISRRRYDAAARERDRTFLESLRSPNPVDEEMEDELDANGKDDEEDYGYDDLIANRSTDRERLVVPVLAGEEDAALGSASTTPGGEEPRVRLGGWGLGSGGSSGEQDHSDDGIGSYDSRREARL